jgi:putative endonuclease
MPKAYYVCILASRRHGTLYVGITNDLQRRISEHSAGVGSAFASRYHVKRLVYYEIFDDPVSAITREKQPKKWRREWKISLIENVNPSWSDLGPSLY